MQSPSSLSTNLLRRVGANLAFLLSQDWKSRAEAMLKVRGCKMADLKEMIREGSAFQWGWDAMEDAPKLMVSEPPLPTAIKPLRGHFTIY
eukprot:scaffold158234_cov17-Prasinocladus_malaysianus.AAC.1